MSTSKARDLPAGQAGERRGASARSRFLVAAIAGAVVGVAGAFGLWELAPLLGWDTAALTYLAWTYATVSHLDPEHTARRPSPRTPAGPPPTSCS